MGDLVWPSDWQFPFGMSQVLADPSILDFVPLHSELTALLQSANQLDHEVGDVRSLRILLYIANIASHDPEAAASRLITKWRVSDRDAQRQLVLCLRVWAQRIEAMKKAKLASALWAYDRLVGILTYRAQGDLVVPEFTFKHTYPLGRLVTLPPTQAVRDSLMKVLTTDTDAEVLKYAAYLLGILNHASGSEPWRLTREARNVVSKRREQIGASYPEVDRQILWAGMLLGDDEAHEKFLRNLRTQNGPAFDAAYNYKYYKGNRVLMEERYERRPQEGLRTDRMVIDTLRLTWQTLRPLLSGRSSVLFHLDPAWWPID